MGAFAEFRYSNPLYSAKHVARMGDIEGYSNRASKYHSFIEGKKIVYMFRLKSTLNMNRIFSIDMETNDLEGNIDNSSNVIWNNNITLAVRCVNEWCVGSGYTYTYTSTPISIERNNSKITPIVLDIEFISIPQKRGWIDENVSLINSVESKETHLLGRRKIISSVPKIPIHKLKDKSSIEQKIKTLLLFS